MAKESKSSSKEDQDYLAEELKQVRDALSKIQLENTGLRQILKDNDLEDEIEGLSNLSPELEICVHGINQILERVKNKTYDNADIKDFDILHKNLRMAQGVSDDSKLKKQKPAKVEDLLKIVRENSK